MAQPLSFSTSFCRVDATSYSSEAWEVRYKRCQGALESLNGIAPGRKMYYHWPDGKFYESNFGISDWIGGVLRWEEGLYRRFWRPLSIKDTIEALLCVKEEMAHVLAIAHRWVEETALDPSLKKKIERISALLPITGTVLAQLKGTYLPHAQLVELTPIIDDFCKDLIRQAHQVLTPTPLPFFTPIRADKIAAMRQFLESKKSEIAHLAQLTKNEVDFIKKGEGKPWTIAVIKGGNSYIHTGARIVPEGEGGKYKTDKRAFCQHGEVAKLVTRMYSDRITVAKNEGDYLTRFKEKQLPNVVQVYDIVYYAKRTVLIQIIYMKYYANGSLFFAYERLKEEPLKIKRIIIEILKGLATLHQEGIVHRDLKPENIFLDEEDHAHIADFGFALNFNAELNELGTPYYMAPEYRTDSLAGAHLDIWAFGMMMYGLLLGKVTSKNKAPWPWLRTARTWLDVCRLNREQKEIDFPEPKAEDIWWHACWETLKLNPRERPSAQELYANLGKELNQELAMAKATA